MEADNYWLIKQRLEWQALAKFFSVVITDL